MAFLDVDNPFTGHLACQVELSDSAHVAFVLDTARAAQAVSAQTDLATRIAWLRAAMAAMVEAAEATVISEDISRMMGKPVGQARAELATMADRVAVMCEIAPAALATEQVGPDDGIGRRILKVPLGVVVDIPAWNYPLLTAINALAPAVLAGNAVIVKHSARSPLCGEHFARAFARSGAPEGLVQGLHLDHAGTAAMLADRRVDHAVFTGSVRGGEAISRAVAGRFMHVGYELGGNDGAYVAVDADIERAVESLVDGATYNSGQSCCGVERIYVHRSRYDDFLAAAEGLVKAHVLGDPLLATTTQGPMAQPNQQEELGGFVRDAERGGGQVLLGGRATDVDGRGRFFEPTLIADVRQDMRLMREESFGPIVAVQPVDSDEQAMRCMDDSELGLTASVWTADQERAERFLRGLDVGTLFRNRCDYVDPWLPWSGARQSGRGLALSHLGFDAVTRTRAAHFRD